MPAGIQVDELLATISMSGLEAMPAYSLFKATCDAGLSAVRPLAPAARNSDADGWNYGPAWPPSYAAFGRLRRQTWPRARASGVTAPDRG